MNIVGGVLAGGQSRRMGGQDKMLLEFGGTTLARHVITRLQHQTPFVALNTNLDTTTLDQHDFGTVALIPDLHKGYAGPLAGIHTLLDWAIKRKATYLITIAVDTPFFPGDLVHRLATEAQTHNGIAIAQSDGFHHPVVAAWPVEIFQSLAEFLKQAQSMKVMHFVHQFRHSFVAFEPIYVGEEILDPFFNINHPHDLEHGRMLLNSMT